MSQDQQIKDLIRHFGESGQLAVWLQELEHGHDSRQYVPYREQLKSTSVVHGKEKSLIDWSMVMEMPCTMTLRSATLEPLNKSMGSDYGELDRRQGEQRRRRRGGYIHVKPAQTKTPCFWGQTTPTSPSKINK